MDRARMDAAIGSEAARLLARGDEVRVEPGLSTSEFDRVRRQWGFEFAADHHAFLAAGLPRGPGWPDWREGDPQALRTMLDWPVDGVLFDVRHNVFWHQSWGPRPDDLDAAVDIARDRLAEAPRMVPVYSHRYLPAGPGMAGHPVLSMHQTDVIWYGTDLADYLRVEFGGGVRAGRPAITVPFWQELVT